ncbi:MAG TPA: hypothetical protein VFV39_10505, partial [Limnobacter sp.]|nr:hypothetical protein [Limnobacter sp.]
MFDQISKAASNNPVLVSALSESLQSSQASPPCTAYRSPGVVTASCMQHLSQQLIAQTQSRDLITDYQLAINMVHLAKLLPANHPVELPVLGKVNAEMLTSKAEQISPLIKDPGLMQPKHQFKSNSLEREIDLLTKE